MTRFMYLMFERLIIIVNSHTAVYISHKLKVATLNSQWSPFHSIFSDSVGLEKDFQPKFKSPSRVIKIFESSLFYASYRLSILIYLQFAFYSYYTKCSNNTEFRHEHADCHAFLDSPVILNYEQLFVKKYVLVQHVNW